MTEYKYVDHLKDYVEGKITSIVDSGASLPDEFKEIDKAILIKEITNQAVPVLRMMEDAAIKAGIESYAALIRYSRKSK